MTAPADIAGALAAAGAELGDGSAFTATLARGGQEWTVTILTVDPERHWPDGALVQTGEAVVLMDATSPRPRPGDRLKIGDDTFVVMRVEGNSTAAYAVHVRR